MTVTFCLFQRKETLTTLLNIPDFLDRRPKKDKTKSKKKKPVKKKDGDLSKK